MKSSIRCIVIGQVQGVFFRASTQQVAQQLGISGYAVNLPDGSVEVVAHGETDNLDKLKQFLGTGPKAAAVYSLVCESVEMDEEAVKSGFRVGSRLADDAD
ncbi:acylphosphatase [Solemya velum gill symbiont]|uniref:acylphosphatase n=1 Tax=Solemya velum gill symbiont TaxID=2340 RepID=A0A0B0HEV0_SOVGS|nr:acylphosphatase [Solemya velum gill symbiont]KHF25981.1 acylphosphatase [Solemya velum gill symbiont]OOY34494.1 hypothetical protein BOV88_10095 [Solemya velum gill symbiont]OOY37206.1 hypothetical protein BOV89_08935 [Solemya velum gill symbiont]OOY41219.1 hypothetical protein BOV90_00370 [Solemya velum gill symbiont]OOY43791.1 hypothetical protein BOV92_10375 [Solemya velum gill symbiont]